MPQSIQFATGIHRDPNLQFGILPSGLAFHLIAFGQTGTGKSSLLLRLMQQFSQHGTGFCLIDPHGDLAEATAEFLDDEAIVWNVADPSCPYGYNPITHVSEQYRPLVASGFIDTLKHQWADAWGVRMEHLLRQSVLALLARPGSSMADIVPLLLDKRFRQEVLSFVTDQHVRRFFELEYAKLNFKTAVDGVAPIANKLGAFLANPVVRKAVCEPEQPLRFRQIMDEGRVLIVNLAKGRLGADVSNVLGGLIVSAFTYAAYSRQDTPLARRQRYCLVADEFHSFTTEAFADAVSEMRKFGLSLILATQTLSNIESTRVRESILGNIGTLMVFRVGATDAPLLAKQLGADIPTPRDLVNLPNYEMFLKLMINGNQSKPFSARTLPPLAA